MVDACTLSWSANAVTVCGPRCDNTISVRNCAVVTSSLTEDSERAVTSTSARLARINASTTASETPVASLSICP
jgi:hypothetical protein